MLTHVENERLCRVGPGTEMGELMRRYWIPCLDSPNQKATSETRVEVPGSWEVISNGRLVDIANAFTDARSSGSDMLQAAKKEYESQNYDQARHLYEKFLKTFETTRRNCSRLLGIVRVKF